MDDLKQYFYLKQLILLITIAIVPVYVQSAVLYKFHVTANPETNDHLPFTAEMELSNSAVVAGQATASDVESLRIVGGNYVPLADPVNFSDLHSSFINLSAILSNDKESIVSMSAQSSENNQQFDFWVFYQPDPNAPGQNVHDNEVIVSANSVVIRSLLLPNYTYAISEFTGEWRRKHEDDDCRICKIFDQYVVGCFPWCPWPWILIGSVIIVIITARFIWKGRK